MSEQDIQAAIRGALGEDGQLSCEAAHEIAARLGVSPASVGKQANRLDIRITICQLGLFGYAPAKGMPGYRIVHELETLPEPVTSRVREAAVDGRVSCLALWNIAGQQKVGRPEIGNVAETLKVKVRPCQLGCF